MFRPTFLAGLFFACSAAASAREVLPLDGSWQFAVDPRNEGRKLGWCRSEVFDRLPQRRPIAVPSCWETSEKDYEGAAWYALRFPVPAAWRGDAVRLRFDAVNYRAEVWVNATPAGFHDGGYTPFELSVGDLLRPGEENFVVVRVLGPILTRDTDLDGIGPNETPHWRGAIAGGIWQPVRLIATPPTFISDLFVQPDLARAGAIVEAEVINGGTRSVSATIDFSLAGDPAPRRRELTLRPGRNPVRTEIPVPNPRLWTPDQPQLYTLTARLSAAGGDQDDLNQRFGMREFTVRDGRYVLNGRPLLLKAAFWEGFYPGTLAFPSSPDLVRREIRLAKEAGFNVLRVWRKPPPPPILDLADELGMMIVDAPPVEGMNYWPQLTPETDGRIAGEIRGMIERDRNHPSVVWWELFNEIRRPSIARLKPGMSRLARDLDPTRVVVDESGGWAGGAHAYPPGSYDPDPINEIHSYLPSPVSPKSYGIYRELGQPGFDDRLLGRSKILAPHGIVFVSEVGYGALPDLPANVARYERAGNPLTPDYRYHRLLLDGIARAMGAMRWRALFPDAAALCQASQRIQAEGDKLQLEALRLNPRINGYCVHAFTDGNWVLGAGLLDLFREPKLAYAAVKHVQTPRYVAVRVEPSNLREGQSGLLQLDSVNDQGPIRGRIEWQVDDPKGGRLAQGAVDVAVPAGVKRLFETRLPSSATTGVHTARIRFVPEVGPAFENRETFYNLAARDLEPPTGRLALIDPANRIGPFLRSRGIRCEAFSPSEAGAGLIVVDSNQAAEGVPVLAAVKQGSTALFLQPPAAPAVGWPDPGQPVVTPPSPAWFPLKLRLIGASGNWAPVAHGVRPHPVFADLPSGDLMGQEYRSICATESLIGLATSPIVGSLGYTSGGERGHQYLNYLGPRDVWWGSDLAAVPYGRGTLILSTLHLAENLGTDPVAEKVFFNLLRWAQGQRP